MKADAFQGKRKVKDWWSKVEYMVVHQVTDDVSAYEVRDDSGNVKIIHCNRLFSVANPWGDAMPWKQASLIQKRALRGPP